MKRLLTAMILATILISPVAASQHRADPGTLPTSAFYGLEQAWESVRLGITFNQTNKARLALQQARERTSEIQRVTETTNDTEPIQRAQSLQSQRFKLSQSVANQTEDQNLTRDVEQAQKQSIETLTRVKEQVPEQDKEAIQQAIENQKKQREKTRGIQKTLPKPAQQNQGKNNNGNQGYGGRP